MKGRHVFIGQQLKPPQKTRSPSSQLETRVRNARI